MFVHFFRGASSTTTPHSLAYCFVISALIKLFVRSPIPMKARFSFEPRPQSSVTAIAQTLQLFNMSTPSDSVNAEVTESLRSRSSSHSSSSPHSPQSPYLPMSLPIPHGRNASRSHIAPLDCLTPISLPHESITECELHENIPSLEETFEIVDNTLVSFPLSCGTVTHQELRRLHTSRFIHGYVYDAATGAMDGTTVATKTEVGGMQEADIVITKRSFSTSYDENPSPSVTRSNICAYSCQENTAYAVVDFTSANFVDSIISKWTEYFEANVQYYYIFHLNDKENTGMACVTVGSLLPIFDSVLSPNAIPVDAASSLSSHPVPGTIYYKTVYCDDDVVDIGPYAAFEYTVTQLMSVSFMKAAVEKVKVQDSEESARILQQDVVNADAFSEIEDLTISNMELKAEFQELERVEKEVNEEAVGATSRDSTPSFENGN